MVSLSLVFLPSLCLGVCQPHGAVSMRSVPACSSATFSLLLQGGACTDACQAPWSRGYACRNGPHPYRHASGGTAPVGSVETEAPSLLQRKCLPHSCFVSRLDASAERCHPLAAEKYVPLFLLLSGVEIPLSSQQPVGILARDEDGCTRRPQVPVISDANNSVLHSALTPGDGTSRARVLA